MAEVPPGPPSEISIKLEGRKEFINPEGREDFINPVPSYLPSCEDIIIFCRASGHGKYGLPFPSPHSPKAWIRYGYGVARSEARTQHAIARAVNPAPHAVVRIPEVYFTFKNGDCGYIVMEYIDGVSVQKQMKAKGTNRDDVIANVAAAVQQLASLRVRAGTPPGPVGGGYITHSLFCDESAIKYTSVKVLQDHINAILKVYGFPSRVDFTAETATGLTLCIAHISEKYFMMDRQNRIVVTDFRGMNFLPPSFASLAFAECFSDFSSDVANIIKFPRSENLRGMQDAKCMIVMSGKSGLCLPKHLRPKIGT